MSEEEREYKTETTENATPPENTPPAPTSTPVLTTAASQPPPVRTEAEIRAEMKTKRRRTRAEKGNGTKVEATLSKPEIKALLQEAKAEGVPRIDETKIPKTKFAELQALGYVEKGPRGLWYVSAKTCVVWKSLLDFEASPRFKGRMKTYRKEGDDAAKPRRRGAAKSASSSPRTKRTKRNPAVGKVMSRIEKLYVGLGAQINKLARVAAGDE